MDEKEFNERILRHFDDMNSVGLAELILFGSGIDRFVENERRVTLLLNHIVKICGYKTNAMDFADMISYEDFKKRRGVSEIAAWGLNSTCSMPVGLTGNITEK